MSGNVWEWTDTLSGWRRVVRGGSWSSLGINCQAALRSEDAPTDAYGILGFRLALVPVR